MAPGRKWLTSPLSPSGLASSYNLDVQHSQRLVFPDASAGRHFGYRVLQVGSR